MGAGLAEDDDHRDCLDRRPCLKYFLIAIFFATILGPMVYVRWNDSMYGYERPEFWAKVPGIEGLERGPGAAAAPVFNVTLRVNNEATSRPFCAGRASATVSYAGVELGHADFPTGFCVPGQAVSSVPIVESSDGLGIPGELYERMESQRRRRERVSLEVQVRMEDCCGRLPVTLWCTAVLHGHAKGPFLCPFAYMAKGGEPIPCLSCGYYYGA